jgi:hypothetical protein
MGRVAGLWCGLLLGLVMVAGGCDETKKPTPAPIATTSAPVAVSASASASASAPAPDPAKAAKWTGTYESKHVTLETPEKVKDVTWKKDDGTKAVGKGQLSMTVKDGTIAGDATGPLGPQKLTGVLDDTTLRLSLVPADPTSAHSMTGSGVGELKDGVISGKLRCAGPKAVVVREMSFELKPAE